MIKRNDLPIDSLAQLLNNQVIHVCSYDKPASLNAPVKDITKLNNLQSLLWLTNVLCMILIYIFINLIKHNKTFHHTNAKKYILQKNMYVIKHLL